jgi:cobalt-zinc-cadmium efflux system outer membrane protein
MPQVPLRTSRPSALGSLGLALVLAVSTPAHALDSKAAANPGAAHTASAHRLLRDPEGLAEWLARQSPQVRAARARARQAGADVSSSHLFPNPVLDAGLSNVPLSSAFPALGDNAVYGVGLSETFELGKRGPRQDAAALRERAARLEVTSALTERVTAARDALGSAVHLGLRLGILQESLTDAERAAALEHTRLEQKALSGMDYDRLLLDLAGLKSEFARNQSEYTGARAECRAALGAECDLTGVSDDDLGDALPVEADAGGEERLSARPDLRSLELQATAARRDADLASNRAIPDVTARVGYVHDRFPGDNMNQVNLGLALPLPVFDRGQHDVHKASERALELEDERRALLADARAALEGLMSRKSALEANIEVLTKETLPRSEAVLTAAEQAFHQGGASMTDFLLARRAHIALTLTRLDQRFELFTVKNELHRVLGLAAPAHQGNP